MSLCGHMGTARVENMFLFYFIRKKYNHIYQNTTIIARIPPTGYNIQRVVIPSPSYNLRRVVHHAPVVRSFHGNYIGDHSNEYYGDNDRYDD